MTIDSLMLSAKNGLESIAKTTSSDAAWWSDQVERLTHIPSRHQETALYALSSIALGEHAISSGDLLSGLVPGITSLGTMRYTFFPSSRPTSDDAFTATYMGSVNPLLWLAGATGVLATIMVSVHHELSTQMMDLGQVSLAGVSLATASAISYGMNNAYQNDTTSK